MLLCAVLIVLFEKTEGVHQTHKDNNKTGCLRQSLRPQRVDKASSRRCAIRENNFSHDNSTKVFRHDRAK